MRARGGGRVACRAATGAALLAAFCVFVGVARAAPPPDSAREIGHLLDYLGMSGCKFFRNGSWYSADRAVRHVNRKYEYLENRDAIDSAESFIEQAASRSSVSGHAYLVKCGSDDVVEVGPWLRAELARYRLPPH